MPDKPIIDLRSDTVTRPSPGMLQAMFAAEVGDDVFGEDPTVTRLQSVAAKMFGMEDSLFCPSGTMTNQIGIRVLTEPQQEVICDKGAHIYYYEGGGIPYNSGVSLRLVDGDNGKLRPSDISDNVNPPENIHQPFTSAVCLENTSNKGGGNYYTLAEMKEVVAEARRHKLRVHLDGARIFNALRVTGDAPVEVGPLFDTISLCLSKGLGAPVGSLIISSKENIHRAKRIRKAFGGGMRQAGFLAAAGLYALENNIARLDEDHRRAAEIANALQRASYVSRVTPVKTNIVVFTLADEIPVKEFLNYLSSKSIMAFQFGKQTVRMVTHLDFTDEMLQRVIDAIKNFKANVVSVQ